MSVATSQSLSRRFDTTREEIIARFRDRITQGKRSKLSKLELEELIDIFLSTLTSTNDPELIQQLCEAEMALLEEGYSSASVAKNYLTKYRKAIALAIDQGRISLNEHNSHSYVYFKDGVEHETTEHWALTYLKYDRAEYEQFAEATTRNNNLKQDELQPIQRDRYLEMVSSLLESQEPLELAIGIAGATGRRYSEVMARGHFSSCDHPYQVYFSGQLKKRTLKGSTVPSTRGTRATDCLTAQAPSQGAFGRSKQRDERDADSYTIFTLVPASKVLAAIERFRVHPDIAAIESASIEAINQFNTPINRLVKHYFEDSDLVPVLKGEARVTIQNLRGIYGEIAVNFFCPPNMGVHRFVQQKLGHLITESELLERKNSGSTEHYFHYYLVDVRGQQLADKGVLLEQISLATTKEQQEQSSQQLELLSDRSDLKDKLDDNGIEEQRQRTSSVQTTQQNTNSDFKSLSEGDNSQPKPEALSATAPISSPPLPQVRFSTDTTPQQVTPTRTLEDLSSLSNDANAANFLTRIRSLIDSDDYQYLLVGLMATTGRDAASLLKLLVFKRAAATHLILYCPQLHPPHQPLLQLLTLLNADDVMNAIASLRRNPDAIDFAHRLTGEEINHQVNQFIPDLLDRFGLPKDLNLQQQYQDLIPQLLKSDKRDRSTTSFSTDTQQNFEQWQQHFSADAETTVNELMRLASVALSSPSPLPSPSSGEPSPWLAIARLSDTVAQLTSIVVGQHQRPFNPPISSTSTSTSAPPSLPQSSAPVQIRKPPTKIEPQPSSASPASSAPPASSASPAADTELDELKSMSSEQLRTSRAKGVPTEKLNRAFRALILYNQQQQNPEDRWRINTSILQQLTGCFNSYVKNFVEQHQSQIDAHNQQFGLHSVRHNSVHKGKDPNDFIHW